MRTAAIRIFLFGIVLSLMHPGIRADAADDVAIGVATSLTTIEGAESMRAAALAVEEINLKGGVSINHRKIPMRLAAIDLQDAEGNNRKTDSLRKLEQLIEEEKLHAVVVGPFRSEILLPAMDIIARRRVPLLETIAMTPAIESMILRDSRYRYVFRTGLNTKYLADALIQIMKHLNTRFGFNRVYLLTQDIAWARSTVAIMIKLYFDRMGWQVLGADHFAYGTSDFSSSLEKAREKGAQVILPIFDMPQSGKLAQQWKEMEIPAMLCGFISPMIGPGAWRAFNGQISGTLNVVFELGNIPSERYPPASAFYGAYSDRYGADIEAGHGPAPSYEAVYLLKDAIESASSLDPEQLVAALEASDRLGCMGRLRFHKGHQVIFGTQPETEAVVCLMQWTRDGKRRIVYPPSIADGEIENPFHPLPLQSH
jgi:branched-chain amino acid transport system substrate-binding protein